MALFDIASKQIGSVSIVMCFHYLALAPHQSIWNHMPVGWRCEIYCYFNHTNFFMYRLNSVKFQEKFQTPIVSVVDWESKGPNPVP